MKPQIPQQPQITLDQSNGLTCKTCGGLFFKQSLLLRRWSKVLTGTPQDYVDAVPVFRCEDCGDVLKEFFPKGMRDVEEKLGIVFEEDLKPAPKAKLIEL